MMDNESVEKDRHHLMDLLVGQYSDLSQHLPVFDEATANAASQHMHVLKNVVEKTENANDVLSLSEFRNAINDLFWSQDALAEELERERKEIGA